MCSSHPKNAKSSSLPQQVRLQNRVNGDGSASPLYFNLLISDGQGIGHQRYLNAYAKAQAIALLQFAFSNTIVVVLICAIKIRARRIEEFVETFLILFAEVTMNFWRFWGDLSTWNKYGLSFVLGVAVLVLLYIIFL